MRGSVESGKRTDFNVVEVFRGGHVSFDDFGLLGRRSIRRRIASGFKKPVSGWLKLRHLTFGGLLNMRTPFSRPTRSKAFIRVTDMEAIPFNTPVRIEGNRRLEAIS